MMWDEIVTWWNTLWIDPKPAATAIGGFVAAFLIFLLKDYFWQKRFARTQKKVELRQQQLDKLYAPLYLFYRETYVRFYTWRKENPDTKVAPQPFFKAKEQEERVVNLFAENAGYASQTLLRWWTAFRAQDEKQKRKELRNILIEIVVKEYQDLRKDLDLDYDKSELKTGQYLIGDEVGNHNRD